MKDTIKQSLQKAIGKLYPEAAEVQFVVDYAPDNVDADFASNAAMVLGKRLGLKPVELAVLLKEKLDQEDADFEVFAVEPGFLNFKLPKEHWYKELGQILKSGVKYGESKIYKGQKARVEYVSANPTGPIHIGNARGGPYGEVICKVLEAGGYKVLREYIHNDIGGQVEKLGATMWYWYKKLLGEEMPFPEGGYQGEYPKEVAEAAIKKLGKGLAEKALPKLTDFALKYIFEENLQTLADLGIKFDVIVKESDLHTSGKTEKAIEELKAKKLTVEKDGAIWFVPNDEFLEDREAVIVKSNGQTTYFASDIAYHKEKFTSGYDLVIDVFGSNHHGHVPKLQALTKIYGFPPEHFQVLLYQYVRVKKGQEVVKMSKRAGNFVTAREVLEEVGRDSMIFLLLLTAVNTHVDFDLDLAKDTSEKNPVFRVQYAHARINSIFVKARVSASKLGQADLKHLQTREELGLMRTLAKYPELVAGISESFAIHQLPHYLLGLADGFHSFYEKIHVINAEDEKLTDARLALVKAVQTVLANGLQLLSIKPLEKM
jgi:arginyl-tRNA synthetase